MKTYIYIYIHIYIYIYKERHIYMPYDRAGWGGPRAEGPNIYIYIFGPSALGPPHPALS